MNLAATDTGSGVYLGKVRIDDDPAVTEVLDDNGNLCRDVNPSNGDPYEFASGTPCKSSAGGALALDTTKLADGPHRLQILVEDAAGNQSVVVDKTVTVDNTGGRIGPGTALALRGAANGVGASDAARIAIRWTRTTRHTLNLSWSRAASIRGRLLDENGQPITGAKLDVLVQTTLTHAPVRQLKNSPTTTATGTFKLTLPRHATSRTITIRYRSHVNDNVPIAQARLALRVRPRITLAVSPHRAVRGTRLRFSGRLVSGPIPRGGKQIVLQAKAGRGAWQRFDVVRTNAHGRFHAAYRFRTAGAARFTFRAVSRYEAAYPYIAGSSAGVHVAKVR